MKTSNRLNSMVIVTPALMIAPLVSADENKTESGKKVRYEATWESVARHDASPQWYNDAVLGIYFHWGVYSVAGMG